MRSRTIKVVELSKTYEERWEKLVDEHPEGRYSHSLRYLRLVEAYSGFCPEYHLVVDGDDVVAVMPLFIKTGFPRKASSVPFADYGGILVSPQHGGREEDALRLLAEATRAVLKRHRLESCEFKRQIWSTAASGELFRRRPLYQLAQLQLKDPAALLKAVDHSVRKNINRAVKSGLVARDQSDPETIRTVFYPMYLRAMQKLSSIPHGIDFFLEAKAQFGDRFKIFIAWHENTPVACLVGWVHPQRVVITQIASDDQYLQMRGPDLVHWELIKWAFENGLKYFDFSLVRYESQAQYKRKWGGEFLEYHLDFVLARAGASLPAGAKPVHDRSLGIRQLKPLMRHLVPLGVTRHIGKPIRLFMGR